ncbi:thioesterase family protein [Streptacidiphilus fuscans]|uniref:Thioesterase family protein n=1 Tax=Streptacidiphilus fuscans TaxID=2789292 RepID=A0A931B7R1_9ACTN|nr:thioesterase family protein [Streptacidiphilus fuscans]MBF9071681.1 thioesterase family protein [Streptacidiphilus fuscans]
MSEFDEGTAVVRRPDEAVDSSVFDTELDKGWQIGGGINGGLLLSLAARSIGEHFAAARGLHPYPVSVSGYYVSASRPGPAELRVETVRAARSHSTGQASLLQADDEGRTLERLRVLAHFGDLARADEDVRTSATPPKLPPVEQCVGTEHAPPEFLASANMLERIDLRLDPAYVGWALGKPSGEGRIQGWFRLADGREPDPLSLLFALDALPPVTFDLGLFGWTPTVELTAHIRALPAPGWLRITHSTRNLAGGYLEEDCEIWDSRDRLVAQSRQLAVVPR